MSVELLGVRENNVKCWKKKKGVLKVKTIVNGLRALILSETHNFLILKK